MAEARQHQDHKGTRAIQRMVEFAPSTGGLALWVRHEDVPPDVKAPVARTDGNTIHYGQGFETLPLAEQTGLIAHEVLHIALRHPQRYSSLQRLRGGIDLQLFNICADAIVNSALSHLTWLHLPRFSVTLDKLLSAALSIDQAIETSLLQWDVERLYCAIDDRFAAYQGTQQTERRQQEGGSRRGETSNGGQAKATAEAGAEAMPRQSRTDGPKSSRVRALGANSLMDLTPAPDAEASPEAEAGEALLWNERIQRSHAGDGLHSLLRTLLADLPRIRTPWEQVLRTQLAHGLSAQAGLSWSRPARSYIASQGRMGPHRRIPWEPGFGPAKQVPRLAVIADVSGSIEDNLLARFAGEIEAMTRRLEAELTLIIGDDRVREVTRCKPGHSGLRGLKFGGRGGTDFTPLLEEAGRHRPDIAIVLTDLDGPARFRPRWPVIWAVPSACAQAQQPFGRKLVLD